MMKMEFAKDMEVLSSIAFKDEKQTCGRADRSLLYLSQTFHDVMAPQISVGATCDRDSFRNAIPEKA